jgi:hypothetical protein
MQRQKSLLPKQDSAHGVQEMIQESFILDGEVALHGDPAAAFHEKTGRPHSPFKKKAVAGRLPGIAQLPVLTRRHGTG